MSESLHTCSGCGTAGFTKRGLKAHVCKGTNRQTKLQLTGESQVPDWSRARSIMEGIKLAARLSLAGQILLGHELQTLKIELGFAGQGRRSKERTHSESFKSLNRTWDQWCKAELGLADSTANRLIETYEAAKSKLKKLGGQPRLLGLLETPPAKLDDEAKRTLSTLVDKLEWGESQKQLLEEFRLVKRHEALSGGDTSQHRKEKPQETQQLAFAFFRPIPTEVAKVARKVENIRLAPNYQHLLHTLPLVSSEPGELSLTSLEAELEATLTGPIAQALEDIRKAKAARMQQPAA